MRFLVLWLGLIPPFHQGDGARNAFPRASLVDLPMEARLLYIQSRDHKHWGLVGHVPLTQAHVTSVSKDIGEIRLLPGVLDLLLELFSEGGACFGWCVGEIIAPLLALYPSINF